TPPNNSRTCRPNDSSANHNLSKPTPCLPNKTSKSIFCASKSSNTKTSYNPNSKQALPNFNTPPHSKNNASPSSSNKTSNATHKHSLLSISNIAAPTSPSNG